MGIEPTSTAWEAVVLPMNYIRMTCMYYNTFQTKMQEDFSDFFDGRFHPCQNHQFMILCTGNSAKGA